MLLLAPFASVGVAILLHAYLRRVGLDAYFLPSVTSGTGLATIAVAAGVAITALFIIFVAPSLILLALATQKNTGISPSSFLWGIGGTALLWLGIYVAIVSPKEPWLGAISAIVGSWLVVTLVWFCRVESHCEPDQSRIGCMRHAVLVALRSPFSKAERPEKTPDVPVWSAGVRAATVGFFLTLALLCTSTPWLFSLYAIESIPEFAHGSGWWAFFMAAAVIAVGLFPAVAYLTARMRSPERGEPVDILSMAFLMVAFLLLLVLMNHQPAHIAVLERLSVVSQEPKTFEIGQDDSGVFRSQGFTVTEKISEHGSYLELSAFVMYDLGEVRVVCTHNRILLQDIRETSTCRRVNPATLVEIHHFSPPDLRPPPSLG